MLAYLEMSSSCLHSFMSGDCLGQHLQCFGIPLVHSPVSFGKELLIKLTVQNHLALLSGRAFVLTPRKEQRGRLLLRPGKVWVQGSGLGCSLLVCWLQYNMF